LALTASGATSPGKNSQLRSEPAELSARERHDHTPEVLSLALEGGPPGPGGSVGIVSGQEGSELVLRAREAARVGDGAGLATIYEAQSQRRRLSPTSVPGADPARIADSVSPVVQVTYHDTIVAEAPIRDEGLCVLLPFAGGSLDPGGFAASTYLPPGVAPSPLTTLVIVSQPGLSDLERRALERLPSEVSEVGHRPLAAKAEVERLLELRRELVLAGREP
jgi:hypothetical protein